MQMQSKKYRIEGATPLLLHNGQLADPLNEWTKKLKAISSKRKKTEEDFIAMSEIEFYGSLYVDDAGHVIIPSEVLESMLVEGAKKKKLGKQFKACVMVNTAPRLEYDGPKTAEGLFKDKAHRDTRGVKVGMARVMRTRPRFDRWALEFTVSFFGVEESDVDAAVDAAGELVGLCDFRPKFGRFTVV